MKKFNYKSRKGFTLIELLVVIGILAVLAAIAIPSVAGLIDRANVSADDTNANEMTNAIERFTSEYELFCQDIASGKLNTNDLDAAQSRVYNVTGADSRKDIEDLENSNLDDKSIDRDTKYPTNVATAKAIVENYTKTSSATFEPKQSDMHFWYSPDCGVVVYGEPEATRTVLNEKIISGKDAKGKVLNENTDWIDMTSGVLAYEEMYVNHSQGVVVEGATYTTNSGAVINAGENFPVTPSNNDTYVYGDYTYKYKVSTTPDFVSDGWKVSVTDKTKSEYDIILGEINGIPVTDATSLYANCTNLTSFAEGFEIPAHLNNANGMFAGCTSLKTMPTSFSLPSSLVIAGNMFKDCTNLEGFSSSLVIPKATRRLANMFLNCSNFSGTIILTCTNSECDCHFVNGNTKVFSGTTKNIVIQGGKTSLREHLCSTSTNGNVVAG